MKITRLDLDGAGSPMALVTRILETERDLPIPVPVEALCERLDISAIADLHTEGFEAALITDEVKSSGAILVRRDCSRQRRRFSVGHELGHFLIPTHMPAADGSILCSARQLRMFDPKTADRRSRMEVEANRFAALLLMPPPVLRPELRKASPDIAEILRLARLFDVSKEAMARSYVEYHREAVAAIVVRNARILRQYRSRDFPFLASAPGGAVPPGACFHAGPGAKQSTRTECEPDVWLDDRAARGVGAMTEQVLPAAKRMGPRPASCRACR